MSLKLSDLRIGRYGWNDRANGEGVILSGTAAGPQGSVSSFEAGTALWTTALLLISIPREFALGVRLVGVATSVLFLHYGGEDLLGEAGIANVIASSVLRIPFVCDDVHGVSWSLLKEGGPADERDDVPRTK